MARAVPLSRYLCLSGSLSLSLSLSTRAPSLLFVFHSSMFAGVRVLFMQSGCQPKFCRRQVAPTSVRLVLQPFPVSARVPQTAVTVRLSPATHPVGPLGTRTSAHVCRCSGGPATAPRGSCLCPGSRSHLLSLFSHGTSLVTLSAVCFPSWDVKPTWAVPGAGVEREGSALAPRKVHLPGPSTPPAPSRLPGPPPGLVQVSAGTDSEQPCRPEFSVVTTEPGRC